MPWVMPNFPIAIGMTWCLLVMSGTWMLGDSQERPIMLLQKGTGANVKHQLEHKSIPVTYAQHKRHTSKQKGKVWLKQAMGVSIHTRANLGAGVSFSGHRHAQTNTKVKGQVPVAKEVKHPANYRNFSLSFSTRYLRNFSLFTSVTWTFRGMQEG